MTKEPTFLCKKEEAIYVTGIMRGMEELVNNLKGSAGTTASNMISTAMFNFLKKEFHGQDNE